MRKVTPYSDWERKTHITIAIQKSNKRNKAEAARHSSHGDNEVQGKESRVTGEVATLYKAMLSWDLHVSQSLISREQRESSNTYTHTPDFKTCNMVSQTSSKRV